MDDRLKKVLGAIIDMFLFFIGMGLLLTGAAHFGTWIMVGAVGVSLMWLASLPSRL